MSTGNDTNGLSKSQTKKKSKRQRQSLQKKLTKLQSTKVKRKRLPKKKKSVSTQISREPPTVETAKTTTEKSQSGVTPTPNKSRKRSNANKLPNSGKTSMPAKKKMETDKAKTSKANTKSVRSDASKKSKEEIVSDQQEIVPDQNWKELSKKLGIKSKAKPSTTVKTFTASTPVEQCSSIKEKWFDDVDEILIEKPEEEITDVGNEESADIAKKLVTPGTKAVLTKCLAMDCEMVGVGPTGDESVLARISVVNQHGHCVYDKFVKAKEEVTDYRTWVSGVRPEDLEDAEDLETVQKEVDEMFKGRILVGHAITNDEKVLFMNHPKKYVRDTQKYQGYRQLVGGRKPGLKLLAQKVLGVNIQSGEHSSVQDAQATMRLYTMIREKWEKKIKEKHMLNTHIKKKLLDKPKKVSMK